MSELGVLTIKSSLPINMTQDSKVGRRLKDENAIKVDIVMG